MAVGPKELQETELIVELSNRQTVEIVKPYRL